MSTTFHAAHANEFRRPRTSTWLVDGMTQARQLIGTLFTKRPPAPLTRREEAHELREMAAGLMASDPAFADDLFAAADRHEGN